MEEKVHVTILTKVYNSENTIEKTIQSVLSQTDPLWTYVIRNNGSTDKTGEICERYAKLDKRIKVFHNKKNNVLDDGRDFRVQKNLYGDVEGEYIAKLDGDDCLDPFFIEKTYGAAKRNHANMVLAGRAYLNEDMETIVEVISYPYSEDRFRQYDRIDSEKFFWLLSKYMGANWGGIYQKDLFFSINWLVMPELKKSGDSLEMLLFWRYSEIVCVISDILYYYRINSKGLSYQLPEKNEIDELECYYLTYYNYIEQLGIKPKEIEQWLYKRISMSVRHYVLTCIENGNDYEKYDIFVHILKNKIYSEICSRTEKETFGYLLKWLYVKCVVHGEYKLEDEFIKEICSFYCEEGQKPIFYLFNAVYEKDNIYNCGFGILEEKFVSCGEYFGEIQDKELYFKLMHNSEEMKKWCNKKKSAEYYDDKKNAMKGIQDGELTASIEKVYKLLEQNPFDKELMKIRQVISSELEDKKDLQEIKKFIALFYAKETF